jgi:hypothetical protein
MRPKSINIPIDLYRFHLVVVAADTAQECEEELSDIWRESSPEDPFRPIQQDTAYWGKFSYTESGHPDCETMPYIAIITKSDGSMTKSEWAREMQVSIAHECTHAAFYILNERGVYVTMENHEALTYLASYIHKAINRELL